jgi:hypothetical protein
VEADAGDVRTPPLTLGAIEEPPAGDTVRLRERDVAAAVAEPDGVFEL